jgi:hypothetical protein
MSLERGKVYTIYFPKPRYEETVPNHVDYMPKPHSVIYGKHDAIILSKPDPTGKIISKDHVHVIAISSCRVAVENDELLATHVPLKKDLHDFLDHDSFALAFQIKTIPSHWIQEENFKGEIELKTMGAITVATFLSTGSWEYVLELVEKMSEQKMATFLEENKTGKVYEDASSDE